MVSWAFSASDAISLTVGCCMISFIRIWIPRRFLMVADRRIEARDESPRAIRSLVTPKSVICKDSETMSNMSCSIFVSGATTSASLRVGLGSALRLVFPLGVNGMESIRIYTVGTIYSVNEAAINSFNDSSSISFSET